VSTEYKNGSAEPRLFKKLQKGKSYSVYSNWSMERMLTIAIQSKKKEILATTKQIRGEECKKVKRHQSVAQTPHDHANNN